MPVTALDRKIRLGEGEHPRCQPEHAVVAFGVTEADEGCAACGGPRRVEIHALGETAQRRFSAFVIEGFR